MQITQKCLRLEQEYKGVKEWGPKGTLKGNYPVIAFKGARKITCKIVLMRNAIISGKAVN